MQLVQRRTSVKRVYKEGRFFRMFSLENVIESNAQVHCDSCSLTCCVWLCDCWQAGFWRRGHSSARPRSTCEDLGPLHVSHLTRCKWDSDSTCSLVAPSERLLAELHKEAIIDPVALVINNFVQVNVMLIRSCRSPSPLRSLRRARWRHLPVVQEGVSSSRVPNAMTVRSWKPS